MIVERRVVIAVIASTFFVGFGGGVVFPILANAPAGSLVDRIGTRTPFVAGLVGACVGPPARTTSSAIWGPPPVRW